MQKLVPVSPANKKISLHTKSRQISKDIEVANPIDFPQI